MDINIRYLRVISLFYTLFSHTIRIKTGTYPQKVNKMWIFRKQGQNVDMYVYK